MNNHQFHVIVTLLTLILNHLRGNDREVFYDENAKELRNT